MAKDKLTKQEIDDLKAQGYVEGNINSFPDNVSPVLRARAMEQWKEENDIQSVEELPTAVDRQNERERQRAAIDGDKEMQKATGVKPEGDNKSNLGDWDNDGVPGGSVPSKKTKK
jgi:hypothetical protein